MDGTPVALAQIGRELKITRERVRQIEARAITKMRKAAKAFGLVEQLY
jgi:RNA polymerase nonessential primary-like sigma factor